MVYPLTQRRSGEPLEFLSFRSLKIQVLFELKTEKQLTSLQESMSHNVDFKTPIPELIERLKREHRELAPKLDEIDTLAANETKLALKQLTEVGQKILHHAVEEEARIMRVIMKNAKSESAESVRIMQEHRWVSEFLERRIKQILSTSDDETRSEIIKFDKDLRQHFVEEEEVVFPLALKAEAGAQAPN